MRALVAALLLVGCAPGAEVPGPADVGAHAMVGGTPAADAAVVAIGPRQPACDAAFQVSCSGTLVAPRVVLTAAHCLNAMRPARSNLVRFGPHVDAPVETIVAVDQAIHPDFDPESRAYDVALLLLSEAATAAPVPLGAHTVDELTPGDALRAVGFGVTDGLGSDFGERLQGELVLETVEAAVFTAGPGPAMSCQGDSGGPVFATFADGEALVGITSSGDPGCTVEAVNARFDRVLADFVQPFLDAADAAPSGWPEQAPAVDALCDQPCATDAECPAGMVCLAELDVEGASCAHPIAPAADYGALCATDADCDQACVALWPDECRCAETCAQQPPADTRDSGSGDSSPGPKRSKSGGCGCAGTSLPWEGWAWMPAIFLVLRRRGLGRERVSRDFFAGGFHGSGPASRRG